MTNRGGGGEIGREGRSRGWVGRWVEGDPARDFGDRRVGGGVAVGDKVGDQVGVGEDEVPTWGEGRAVAHVAGVGLEKGLGAGTGDKAGPR